MAPYRSRFASPPPNPTGMGGALRRSLVDLFKEKAHPTPKNKISTSPMLITIDLAKLGTLKLPSSGIASTSPGDSD